MVFKTKKIVRKPRTRAEIIRAGNIARRGKIKSRDVARQRATQRRREEAERKRKMERIKREYQEQVAKAAQAQQEAEAKRIREGRAFYFANRERMSFSQTAGQPFPVPVGGSQIIGGKFVTDPKTGKQVLESAWQKKQRDEKLALVQKQYESVKTQYGQAKADVGLEKMGYSIEKPRYTVGGVQVSKGVYDKALATAETKKIESRITAQQEIDKTKKIDTGWKKLSTHQKAVVGASAAFSGKGFEVWSAIATGDKQYAVDVAKEHYEESLKPGFVTKTAKGAIWGTPTGRAGVMLGTVAGFGAVSGTTIGAAALKSGVGKIGLAAMTVGYGGAKAEEGYSIYKSGDKRKAVQFGMETLTEVGALAVGGRAAIKESTMAAARKLPPKQRAEFFKKFREVEKLKDPKIRDVDLSKIERIPSKKAANILEAQIKERGLKLGGSAAEQAQLKKPSIVKPKDADLYTKWFQNPIKEAKLLEARWKAAGVKRVSRVNAEVTIAGKKAVEFHPASQYLYSNIKTVESVFVPARAYIGRTPSGIKVLKIKPQLKRELVAGMLEGSTKHYERFGKTFADVLSQQDALRPKSMKGMTLAGSTKYKTLYHQTSPKNIKSIMKEGLKPIDSRVTGVFLAEGGGKALKGATGTGALLEVKIPMKEFIKAGGYGKYETIIFRTIKPKDIKLTSKTTRPTDLTKITTSATKETYTYKPTPKVLPLTYTPSKYKPKVAYKSGSYNLKKTPYKVTPYKKPIQYKTTPYRPKAPPYKAPPIKPAPPYKPSPPYKTPTIKSTPTYKPPIITRTPPYKQRRKKQTAGVLQPRFKIKRKKPTRQLYKGKTKYKPSLIGVIKQKKIKEEPKKLTGYDIRGILTGSKKKIKR